MTGNIRTTGKIIKGIAGFYYVHTADGVYECKAKGVFRRECRKPLPGDDVDIDITDAETCKGNITDILPRRNSLIRPAVANVDQAVVIFAVHKPEPVFGLLDRFLVMMRYNKIPAFICFNKDDYDSADSCERVREIYRGSGADIIFTSAINNEGIEELRDKLRGKTTTAAGPSGVGKSTIVNALIGNDYMETGDISRKIERGKQTTRHTELIPIEKDTFILDTPGFSSIELPDIDKENVRNYFQEFTAYNNKCYFAGCMHINEPDCAVKDAVRDNMIDSERYRSYLSIYDEISRRRKYN